MNGRPLTDAQISQALHAHLPQAAAPGLRERVFEAAATTAQLRSFPSFLGALSDADPVSRRRSLLLAASVLVALALASAVAVGALRLLERDPIDELSLEPPTDLPAFVLSSYERLPQLPPVALTWRDSDSAKGRIYVDRSGAVRFDRFASADATEPSSSTILSADHRISGMALVESEAVWVEQGDEASIGDDPRVFLRTVLRADEEPGCEMERDPSGAGDGTAATGWRYVGLEYVAGRPTHHVTCGGGDLWLDIETRLILRVRHLAVDDAGSPMPGAIDTTEVSEIAFGEQPAALFEPPEGITRMSADAYGAYLCTAGELPNEQVVGLGTREGCPTEAEASPQPEPEPSPTPTVRPSLGPAPSGPAGPLAWTEASLKEDWPAPVREEPAGGAIVLEIRHRDLTPRAASDESHEWESDQYRDPTDDTGSDAHPWADIRWVEYCREDGLSIGRVSYPPHAVDPRQLWIARGVVVDADGDGVPDWRYGVDNVPLDTTDSEPDRWWRTDLHTGRTDWAVGDHIALRDGGPGPVFYPGSGCGMSFGAETAGDHTVGGDLPERFYAWASVIVNGRVVATDYAPDVGWLDRSPDAKPLPKPGGTYVLQDPFPVHLSMTVPAGWTDHGGPELTREGWDGVLQFVVLDNPQDACTDTIRPTPGPGVEDLVSYVKAQPYINISEVRDGTVGGYRAAYLEYRSEDFYCLPTPIPAENFNDAWILDVDGVPLVIAATSDSAPAETVRSEVRQIVDSIHFER